MPCRLSKPGTRSTSNFGGKGNGFFVYFGHAGILLPAHRQPCKYI